MLYSPSRNGFFLPEIHGDQIPGDAVEISDARHAALLDGQSAGQRIVAGDDGQPILADPPPPSTEEIASWARERRDALLLASDMTQLLDSGLTEQARLTWVAYRAALKALPEQPTFPSEIDWPVAPGA